MFALGFALRVGEGNRGGFIEAGGEGDLGFAELIEVPRAAAWKDNAEEGPERCGGVGFGFEKRVGLDVSGEFQDDLVRVLKAQTREDEVA